MIMGKIGVLNVGTLKALIKDLPDDMEVWVNTHRDDWNDVFEGGATEAADVSIQGNRVELEV